MTYTGGVGNAASYRPFRLSAKTARTVGDKLTLAVDYQNEMGLLTRLVGNEKT